jgi:hypothetical protein
VVRHAELPVDRAPYEALVTAVLAWKDPRIEPRDCEQIALQRTRLHEEAPHHPMGRFLKDLSRGSAGRCGEEHVGGHVGGGRVRVGEVGRFERGGEQLAVGVV